MPTVAAAPVASLFSAIEPGSTVSIISQHGSIQKGRCVMKFPTHAVLNLGGRHGTSGIATDKNVCKVGMPRIGRKALVSA